MSLQHDADGFLVGTPSGTVNLGGVLANTLGGFLVVRGFANLNVLAGRSQADHGYQRELKSDHLEDIQHFYQRGEYLFFPEIVLSLELLADFDKKDRPSDDPIKLISQAIPSPKIMLLLHESCRFPQLGKSCRRLKTPRPFCRVNL